MSGKYGVPPRVIVAVWGLESNFGRFSGVRPTIQALATLAWEGRRGAFFRGELMDALAIVDKRLHRARVAARVVGRGDGADAVHAVELSQVGGRFRRRRRSRHLALTAGHLRVDRQLPARTRLDARASRGAAKCGCRPAGSQRCASKPACAPKAAERSAR